jgi:hypothetical protein
MSTLENVLTIGVYQKTLQLNASQKKTLEFIYQRVFNVSYNLI